LNAHSYIHNGNTDRSDRARLLNYPQTYPFSQQQIALQCNVKACTERQIWTEQSERTNSSVQFSSLYFVRFGRALKSHTVIAKQILYPFILAQHAVCYYPNN